MDHISARLNARCGATAAGRSWLARLPDVLRELSSRWSLSLGAPFDGEEASSAWVAPAQRADGRDVVLKVAWPHFESEHESDGLRFWSGEPTVHLLDADQGLNAMLLERCVPGATLRTLPEPEQDVVIAALLRRLWRPAPPHCFRPLSAMLARWTEEARADPPSHTDAGLMRTALNLFEELSRPAATDVLLATDLHAGNVLRAAREPWLAIDPKPFVGDRAYDATQHLLNCPARVLSAPDATIVRFSELLQVDAERVRQWLFARAALHTEASFHDASELAWALAP